jgi:hypothetical protein
MKLSDDIIRELSGYLADYHKTNFCYFIGESLIDIGDLKTIIEFYLVDYCKFVLNGSTIEKLTNTLIIVLIIILAIIICFTEDSSHGNPQLVPSTPSHSSGVLESKEDTLDADQTSTSSPDVGDPLDSHDYPDDLDQSIVLILPQNFIKLMDMLVQDKISADSINSTIWSLKDKIKDKIRELIETHIKEDNSEEITYDSTKIMYRIDRDDNQLFGVIAT